MIPFFSENWKNLSSKDSDRACVTASWGDFVQFWTGASVCKIISFVQGWRTYSSHTGEHTGFQLVFTSTG